MSAQHRPFKAQILGDLVSLLSPSVSSEKGDRIKQIDEISSLQEGLIASSKETARSTGKETEKETPSDTHRHVEGETETQDKEETAPVGGQETEKETGDITGRERAFVFKRSSSPANRSLGLWVVSPPLNANRFIFRSSLRLPEMRGSEH